MFDIVIHWIHWPSYFCWPAHADFAVCDYIFATGASGEDDTGSG